MAENGRKWSKMAGNGLPRVSRRGHRGDQVGNGRKWPKMAENGLPRENGGKWISARFPSFPYYFIEKKYLKKYYYNLVKWLG